MYLIYFGSGKLLLALIADAKREVHIFCSHLCLLELCCHSQTSKKFMNKEYLQAAITIGRLWDREKDRDVVHCVFVNSEYTSNRLYHAWTRFSIHLYLIIPSLRKLLQFCIGVQHNFIDCFLCCYLCFIFLPFIHWFFLLVQTFVT